MSLTTTVTVRVFETGIWICRAGGQRTRFSEPRPYRYSRQMAHQSACVLVDGAGSVLRGNAAGPGPPALMQALDNGAYTTAQLLGPSGEIVDWHLHERRLTRCTARDGRMGLCGLPCSQQTPRMHACMLEPAQVPPHPGSRVSRPPGGGGRGGSQPRGRLG